jgi:hypothetical protein
MNVAEVISGLGRPVVIYPKLAKALGGVQECALLCQLLYWHDRGGTQDGWIWKSQEELEAETGLSRWSQKTARNHLRELRILEEKYDRLEHRMYFRVHTERLQEVFNGSVAKEKTGSPGECGNATLARQPGNSPSECGNTTLGNVETPHSGARERDNPTVANIRAETTKTESTTTTAHAREGTPAKAAVLVVEAPSSSLSFVGGKEEPSGELTPQDRLDLDQLGVEFGSDGRQQAKAEGCAKRRGMAFVREQASIVRNDPKIRNLAGAFEKACDSPEGWKRPKAAPKKPTHRKPVDPKPEGAPSEPRADFSAELAWWQSATEAQKEDILRDPRFDLFRKSMRKGVTPSSLGLPVLREVLAELARKAACAAAEMAKAQQPEQKAA